LDGEEVMRVVVNSDTAKLAGYEDFREVLDYLGWECYEAHSEMGMDADYYITHRHPVWRGWKEVECKLVEAHHYVLRDAGYFNRNASNKCVVTVDDLDEACYT
jgi:hypothetical protein